MRIPTAEGDDKWSEANYFIFVRSQLYFSKGGWKYKAADTRKKDMFCGQSLANFNKSVTLKRWRRLTMQPELTEAQGSSYPEHYWHSQCAQQPYNKGICMLWIKEWTSQVVLFCSPSSPHRCSTTYPMSVHQFRTSQDCVSLTSKSWELTTMLYRFVYCDILKNSNWEESFNVFIFGGVSKDFKRWLQMQDWHKRTEWRKVLGKSTSNTHVV